LNAAVEVDGPAHFASNSRQPLGNTVLKRRLIGGTGLRLCVVPVGEWAAGKGGEEEYLARLLASGEAL
jgi:hypothetical protein